MKEPPYDDELIPTLLLLGATVIFAALVLLAMWSAREYGVLVPPSSTLPRLP